MWPPVHHLLKPLLIERQELGVGNRVDVTLTRRAPRQKGAVTEPPVRRRELEDDFLALGVDHIAPQAARGHERRIWDGLAGALQKLASSKRPRNEQRFEEIEFLRRVGRPASAFEVSAERIECTHRCPASTTERSHLECALLPC